MCLSGCVHVFDWLRPYPALLETGRVKLATESFVWEFGSSRQEIFF